MSDPSANVILVGGAPGAGKTTLGAAIAERLGFTSLTVDDLITATHAVTTPQTHPGLHVMRRKPFLEYFTNSSVDELKADATAQHDAIWPVVERVIRKRARMKAGIVIDGWHLRPRRVAELDLATVLPVWLYAEPAVLEARERANGDFLAGSADPDRMLENFLARSLWYNEFIRKEAGMLAMCVLTQSGDVSVDELCAMVMAKLPA